ncbi:hypothetical protein [Vibrio alginolyticus]|uniref:hypothetical protein n=1 Tax=Vibrio alginolyticus TaxID=663 RepID=UPI001BD3C831|nr:hypothetical protein [Vibrio alginolyticus]MBS9912688.1 hypothetical protein [Vibrio alginolyticus]MBT0050523.1 hypothetical protein [Vibrio alginolyticus]MBT0064221.1 hypothetical protein [Vibrio alginolyticus]MCR9590924.1 hypothetical protein [Vibrio alginolyticus]
MKRIWSLFMRVLLALNMFVLHLLTGQSDLTISGWSYIRVRQGKRSPIKRESFTTTTDPIFRAVCAVMCPWTRSHG